MALPRYLQETRQVIKDLLARSHLTNLLTHDINVSHIGLQPQKSEIVPSIFHQKHASYTPANQWKVVLALLW